MIIELFYNFSERHPVNLYNNPVNNTIISMFTLGDIDKEREKRWLLNVLPFCKFKDLNDYSIELLINNDADICYSDYISFRKQYHDEIFFPLSPNVVALFSKKRMVDKFVRKITNVEKEKIINYFFSDDKVTHIYASKKETIESIKNKYDFYCKYIAPKCEKVINEIYCS